MYQTLFKLPATKFIKGLSPCLHIAQIVSYDEMNLIARKTTQELLGLLSVFLGHRILIRNKT